MAKSPLNLLQRAQSGCSVVERVKKEIAQPDLPLSSPLQPVFMTSLLIHYRSGMHSMFELTEIGMGKEFYTVEEIAELLRVRPGTVRNRLSQRKRDLPPSVVIGRRRLFPLGEYEIWKQQRWSDRLR